ncbi:MAG: hypothetical protein Q7R52_02780 [archaeon]|nr:hypothetical protein [archaeon]
MTADNKSKMNLVSVQHSKDVVPDFIPTSTIKKSQIEATMDTNTMRSSYTPTAGQRGVLTYLHLATNIEKVTFALTDRDGTFDIFQLGTTNTLNRRDEIILQGDVRKPIHVIKGTFGVYNAGAGSYAAGSHTISWEAIKL